MVLNTSTIIRLVLKPYENYNYSLNEFRSHLFNNTGTCKFWSNKLTCDYHNLHEQFKQELPSVVLSK